jgi:hypothetical protein
VRGEKLDAVLVRVSQVQKERVADSVPAGTPIDFFTET